MATPEPNGHFNLRDPKGRPVWMANMERCRHFNGLMSKVCAAGVNYDELRKSGMFPCLLGQNPRNLNIAACHLVSYPTEDEAKAMQAEEEEYLANYFQSIAGDVCPICHQAITKKQVGRCVYGSCGHRLYQGRA